MLVAVLVIFAPARVDAAWFSDLAGNVGSVALEKVIERVVAASGGRLTLEGVQGTIVGPATAKRLVWRDGATSIVAEDVTLEYTPSRLLRGRIEVSELRARRLVIVPGPGRADPASLPVSLELPLDIAVERIAIGTLEWKDGDRPFTLSNIALRYAGDKQAHRITGLNVDMEGAKVTGDATIGASKPFPVKSFLALALSPPYPQGRVTATLGGDLAALQVIAKSELASVPGEIHAKLAPFSPQPFAEGRGDARGIDLARFNPAWPVTKLDLDFEAVPAPNGVKGHLALKNGAAGPVDKSRLPVRSAKAGYVLAGRKLSLDSLVATLENAGTLSGGGTLDFDTLRSRWKLDVKAVNLRGAHTALVDTSLSGRLEADITDAVQQVGGELAQADKRIAFDARYDGKQLTLERVTAHAAGGSIEGKGRIDLAGAKPFAFDGRASRFDPSRFGDFPAGALSGTVRVKGTVEPRLSMEAEVVVSPGSRLAGLATLGDVRGRFTSDTVSGLDANLALGANRIHASGAYGRAGDQLKITVAAVELADFKSLLPKTMPQPLSGAFDATATFEGMPSGARITLVARGKDLTVGNDYRFASLAIDGSVVHAAPLQQPRLEALRDVKLALDATGAKTPHVEGASAHVELAGSAVRHTIALVASDAARSMETTLAASLERSGKLLVWRGRVESLVARGLPTYSQASLAAPMTFEIAADRVELGKFTITGADTTVEADGLTWRDGDFATAGRFRGLPVAPLIAEAGVSTAGLRMDLVLGGSWNVRSRPEWSGTLTIQREGGDVYVPGPEDDAPRIALGVETVMLDAKLDGRRITGNAEVRAKVAGSALTEFEITAPPERTSPFDLASALRAVVRAHVPDLAALQPWIGTAARVKGQAIVDATLGGTLGQPDFAGQLVGYELRYDMPQYGISFRDGKLRIVGGADGLILEEFRFASGKGTFTASGAIGLPLKRGARAAPSHITWNARNLRVLNRPDLRFTVDGDGSVGFKGGRLALDGRIKVDEGYVEYRSQDDTQLADDIVVVGSPRPGRGRLATSPASGVPIDLDLTVDLGDDLRFNSEGLDARLAGRVQLTSSGGGLILAKGTIQTVRGSYLAFGQKLAIERGLLIFDGPVANPSLDVVALRKNLAVEAGVEIVGTVRNPVVRLVSEPGVPDTEKLSWLLTGGRSGSASAQEAAALSAAMAALVGQGGRSITQQFADTVGLDEFSIGQRVKPSSDAVGQTVTLGKRINDRLFVAYEQGLTVAQNVLRLEYVLTRFFTLSAFAGTQSGVELGFRRSWP